MGYELKNDRYRKARGGKATVLDVYCNNCGNKVLVYQKDGIGHLKRCYLNRILAPPELEKLQRDSAIQEPKDMQPLSCQSCKTVVGTPMRYADGRLAFRIRMGFLRKEINKEK